ncbi:MAG TPA: UbiH/UbiF family hydroxylase [Bauldia sp.]|nr:UbiH/UbiF family hydroxylase [Bauldia sp.]
MTAASIAVVGAGPVGLAAAALLADGGHDVALVAPAAPADRRTSALLAGSVALLTRLGVWPDLAEDAAPLRTMRIVDGTRRLIRAPEVAFEASEIGLDAFGYNVANKALVAALERGVAARNIRRIDALAESAALNEGSVVVSLASGEQVVARLVVAADGRRSKLRDAAGITTTEWRYAQAALVCDFAHTLPHRDTSTEFHTEHGPFTLVPLPGNRSSLVWVDTPEQSQRRLALPDDALASEIERRSASILGKVTVEGGRQVFPLSGLSVRSFAANRIALVGEAAHVFPPIGAQGLNLGYRDVAALGDVIADPTGDPGAPDRLAAYDGARRVDVMSRTAAVDTVNRTLLSDFLPASALRGLGLFLVDRVPRLRRFAMRQGLAAL